MFRFFVSLCFIVLFLVDVKASSGYGAEFETSATTIAYQSPFRGIKKVAIVPFFSLTDNIDVHRFDLAFAGQMENYPGWEIIYPQLVNQLASAQKKTILTSHDAISIARELGADAVIIGEIRDFDAYYPPKIVLKVALYRTNFDDSSRDIMNLARRGIDSSKYGLKRGEAVYTLSESYDTGREHVMNLIKRYAVLFNQQKDPMRYDLFLRSQERFFEAISYTIRQDMLYAQNASYAKEGEQDSPLQYKSSAEAYRQANPGYIKAKQRRQSRGHK